MALKKEIENLIKSKIEEEGFEFLGVELKGRKIIITIDKPSRLKYRTGGKKGGLSVEDCARVSRLIDPIIEKANLIEGKYFLIVSSPGVT